MKKISLAVGLVFLCSFAAFAQSEPYAGGSFRFETAQGTQTIQFSARTSSGRTTGDLSYEGAIETPDIDVDGDGGRYGGKYPTWTLKVSVDCMVVRENRAALSGIITGATQDEMEGRRVILTVEDNGQGSDRFAWGLYRTDPLTWYPADAELRFDEGWSLQWEATDFERKDDVPIPGRPPLHLDCSSFPLGAYGLEDLKDAGDIVVRP